MLAFVVVSPSGLALQPGAVQAGVSQPRPVDAALLLRLQPWRVHRDALPRDLAAIAQRVERKQYSDACRRLATLRTALLRQAAPLFYQPDRRRGGDAEGIAQFLRAHVEGPKPHLQIVHEQFVPAASMRALAVDVCVRAGSPELAEPFVRDLALLNHDAQARLALGLLRAQVAGDWRAAAVLVDAGMGGPRAALVRALAGEPPGAEALVAQAWRQAASPEEAQLIGDIATRLRVRVPATPAGQAP